MVALYTTFWKILFKILQSLFQLKTMSLGLGSKQKVLIIMSLKKASIKDKD